MSEAAEIIQEAADAEANIIFGTVIDRAMQGKVKVTVIATGFGRDAGWRNAPEVRDAREEPEGFQPQEEVPAASPGGGTESYQASLMDLDSADDGLPPNFRRMKDDLDVPAFLRKQMD